MVYSVYIPQLRAFPSKLLVGCRGVGFVICPGCLLYNDSGGGNCLLYKKIKPLWHHRLENYLLSPPKSFSEVMLKLRSCNHKLPVERRRHCNIPRERRYCDLCDHNVIGD